MVAAENQLSTDVLASVLASVISSNRTEESIRDHTGVLRDDVSNAIAHLCERSVIRDIGFGHNFDPVGRHYHASQTACAGPCSRGGRELRGQEVVINPETLTWVCADCREPGAGSSRDAAPSGDGTVDAD